MTVLVIMMMLVISMMLIINKKKRLSELLRNVSSQRNTAEGFFPFFSWDKNRELMDPAGPL